MKRTIIGLRKKNGKLKIPTFTECLVDYFNKDSNSVTVNYCFENDFLVLDESDVGYEFYHSPECAFRNFAKSEANQIDSSDYKNSSIGLAASVVVESSDNHILLTKRSSLLRTSPNSWVAPGGHVDYGETLIEAGVREVKEETGLIVNREKLSVLGLWENVYPILLGFGKPKTHTLVVYFHAQLNENSEQLKKKIISNPQEVESYCWMSASTVYKLLRMEENLEQGKQCVYEEGKMVEKSLDYNKMFNKWMLFQPGFYTGSNFALEKYLNKYISKNPNCKF